MNNIKLIRFGYDIGAPTFIGELVYDSELDKEVMINAYQIFPKMEGGAALLPLHEPFGKENNNLVIIPNDSCVYFEPHDKILNAYLQMKNNIVITKEMPKTPKIIT